MEQIIVRHPNGGTLPLISRTNISVITSAQQRKELLGEDVLNISVSSVTPLNFYLGDKILIYGSKYVLNQLPTVTKTKGYYQYTLQFEGPQYMLMDAQWLLPIGTVYNDYYNGDIEDYLDVIITNANRIFPGKWIKGTFPADSEFKNLDFSGKNCLEALQNICKEWETEFELVLGANETITINLKTVGVTFPYTFKYGRTGGLYSLTRKNVDNDNIITRLYVYGGSSNLGSGYRFNKLCLADKTRNESYIEDQTALQSYGVKEGYVTFPDIFPNRIGEVTQAAADDPEVQTASFADSTMPFDLNETDEEGNTLYLIQGVTAKIHFNSGDLAGYDFDITEYDHETKTFTIKKYQDENGNWFPGTFAINTGDKYIITDINLPSSYIEQAETELQEKGEEQYAVNCTPQVSYALKIDERFLSQFSGNMVVTNLFEVGDSILIQDSQLNVNRAIRITSFSRNMLRSYDYDITIADKVTVNTIVNIIEEIQEINNVITLNNLNNPASARRNWMAIQEVLANIFDPEGYYFSEKIKPLSIETTMLAVAAKSQQFILRGTTFEPNYGGDPNIVRVVGGQLIHYAIEETIKTWYLSTATISGLNSALTYYVYAKCSRSQTSGTVIIDTTQYVVDSDPNFYYFLIGTLSSAITDDNNTGAARILSLTYGASTINGRFIKTGRIMSSAGGVTYFDLDEGEIGGKIKFKSGTSGYNNISDAPDLSGFIDETDGLIEIWHKSVIPTTSNTPASNWTTADAKNEHIGDLCYYQSNVQEGEEGREGSATSVRKWYRWARITSRDSSTPSYTWQWQEISPIPSWFSYLTTASKLFAAFVTPTPPYAVNDVWINGGVFLKCITAKAEGEEFNDGDWADAGLYDNTQTTIDGGMVTSGTIQLAGDDSHIKAGITGQGTADTSVRIWAGATFVNRANAPFRVLQDGKMYAAEGEFNGKVSIANGKIILNTDGSGQLANGNITWNANGEATFNGDIYIDGGNTQLNTDGSGQLVGGNVIWTSGGALTIQGILKAAALIFTSHQYLTENTILDWAEGNIITANSGCSQITLSPVTGVSMFFIYNNSGSNLKIKRNDGYYHYMMMYNGSAQDSVTIGDQRCCLVIGIGTSGGGTVTGYWHVLGVS